MDQNLNRRKNIWSDNNAIEPNPEMDQGSAKTPRNFVSGVSREELSVLGEGAHIRVVAFMLVARRGNPESGSRQVLWETVWSEAHAAAISGPGR